MEDDPVLPRQIGHDRIMPRPDPAVAVHAQHERTADTPLEQRDALGVDKRAQRVVCPADENRIAGQRPITAVGGRAKEIVVAAAPDDERPLVAIGDRDGTCVAGSLCSPSAESLRTEMPPK